MEASLQKFGNSSLFEHCHPDSIWGVCSHNNPSEGHISPIGAVQRMQGEDADKAAGGVPEHPTNPAPLVAWVPQTQVKDHGPAIEGALGGGGSLIKRRRDATDVWGRKKPTIRTAPALPDMQTVKETSPSSQSLAKARGFASEQPDAEQSAWGRDLAVPQVSTPQQPALPHGPPHPSLLQNQLSTPAPARGTVVVAQGALPRAAPPAAAVQPPLLAQSVTVMAFAMSSVRDPSFPRTSPASNTNYA